MAAFVLLLLVEFTDGPTSVIASCTGYYSDTTPPSTIRVYHNNPLRGADYQIYTRDFKTYVKESLPWEWAHGQNPAALQAGAMAVKTFAWYWVNHGPGGSVGGQCYDVDSTTGFQVWAPCPGLWCNTQPDTDYAIEQSWNWLLHASGSIYQSQYRAGCPTDDACPDPSQTDPCGWVNLVPGVGQRMSTNGSQTCATVNGNGWPRIVSTYYYSNPTTPGEHIYGQWHATMSWGGAPYSPVSVSGYTWKYRSSNNCGGPTTPVFDYGSPGDIFVVGDWNGDGYHSQGVARPGGGTITWFLRNSRTSGNPDFTPFAYGSIGEGDIPVVGDWDGNGTWTIGVFRNYTWLLRNTNGPGNPDIVVSYGSMGDTPVPGKWKAISAGQPMTIGVVRLAASGYLQWWLRDSNTGGDPTIPVFEYGGYDARPLSGDYLYGGLSQFGVGVVTDAQSPSGCTTPNPNQTWLLHVCPCAGPPDMAYFYELNRP